MPWNICPVLLLLLGIFPMAYFLSNDCPSSMCGDQEIKFPFSLQSSSKSCREAGLSANLSCSTTKETIITFPSLESYRVTDFYDFSFLAIDVLLSNSSSSSCPWKKGIQKSPNVNGSIFAVSKGISPVLVNCTTMLRLQPSYGIFVQPISCLREIGPFVYAVEDYDLKNIISPSCMELSSRQVQMTRFFLRVENDNTQFYSNCIKERKNSGYDIRRDKRFCFSQNSHQDFYHDEFPSQGSNKLVKGIVIGATLVVFLIAALVVLYLLKKHCNEKKKQIKVKSFLATYKSTTLTRYNFANIKKITKKFSHKLGQGGFGSVYKGELTNGIPVAVKILEASNSNGDDFVNEVATVGKIHHANVVRLLGFSSDGTNRALVYEYMPNESLEKFIFLEESKKKHELLTMEKLQEIAIGIAQGINYLHQGYNERILHFDIKPHNILLDYDFNPKISDFGLAKLCSRDQSIVEISAARGTMGYIAPEVYSRNFGLVSHKSDVYSYGMLLLEMVGRRKNVDPDVENLSEIYFPEWVYNKLVQHTNLGLPTEIEGNVEIMKKLAIIALWCIQWNPTERPSMSKVVQMLTMNVQSLVIPPTPFVPSSDNLGIINV